LRTLLPVLLALLLLTACGTDAKPAMEVLEVPAFSLPETADAEPVSAPAVVTEGRAPAEDYDLPPSPAAVQEHPRYNMERWASGGVIELLAEAPEADAAFYGLPYSQDAQETALIRWGDSLAEFDWDFATPRMFPPRMAAMDLEGDGENELAVLTYTGSGTGVSVWDLHVVEKNEDGTLTDYSTFYYAEGGNPLWEGVSSLLRLERAEDRAFLILGRELAEVDSAALPEEDRAPSVGDTIQFEVFPEECRIRFWGGVDVVPTWYIADLSADVAYRDGVFTLSNFHLYGNTFFEERRP